MTDPISDFVATIKNAYLARHNHLETPSSKIKIALARVLVNEGFLKSTREINRESRKYLEVELLYHGKSPSITNIRRVSKPGVRIFSKSASIPKVLGGQGISILSTPKGIMSNRQARKSNNGGEVICQVW